MPPKRNEAAFNQALSQLLTKNLRLDVIPEATQVFENRRIRPDIVVDSIYKSPIVIEVEYSPARSVEDEAISRIGNTLKDTGDIIEHAIALRAPESLARVPNTSLEEEIIKSHFDVALFTRISSEHIERWPEPSKSWISCDIDGLVQIIELSSISERMVGRYISTMESGVDKSANILARYESEYPDIVKSIAESLHQESGQQTCRMAMAIVLNALLFHYVIAGRNSIKPLEHLTNKGGTLSKDKIIKEWQRILDEINYYPIFSIARDILKPMPQKLAYKILHPLSEAADHLIQLGITTSHDLAGRMFQRLITDRKFLATYYTLPESAYLLADLAVERLNQDWKNLDTYPELRVADFACGTGTLLSAAYQGILAKARQSDLDDAVVHRNMIEEAMIGIDIMPAATHLAISQLACAHPTEAFGNTRIYTMPYGTTEDKGISTGSLELIQDDKQFVLFTTGAGQLSGESEVNTDRNVMEIPAESLDICIMNPPFTRPTNHEADHYNVPIPSFAAFRTTHDEQEKMSQQLKRIRDRLNDPAGNGNAGLASYFIDLAHQKTKSKGTVALVLPLTFVQGGSWESARLLLDQHYNNKAIISISSHESTGRAFSADTGMAEVLIIANKLSTPSADGKSTSTLFVNILRRPKTLTEGYVVAKAIRDIPQNMNSGKLKSGTLNLGNWYRGSMLDDAGGIQVRAREVTDTCRGLISSKLKLPRLRDIFNFPMVSLAEIGNRGPVHRDIAGEPPRGLFDVYDIGEGDIPTYPMLWNHSAERERYLVVGPDKQGEIRQGASEDAIQMWKDHSTQLHFTLDFRINSQSLTACLTDSPTIGGRAWPGYSVQDKYIKPILLWSNTTLGIMNFWYKGTRQQQGRSCLTITSLPSLVILDPRKLTKEQLILTEDIFNEVKELSFRPANEAYRDDTRKLLDKLILCDLMELPEDILEPLELIRNQWCGEPTVHGGKLTNIHDNMKT